MPFSDDWFESALKRAQVTTAPPPAADAGEDWFERELASAKLTTDTIARSPATRSRQPTAWSPIPAPPTPDTSAPDPRVTSFAQAQEADYPTGTSTVGDMGRLATRAGQGTVQGLGGMATGMAGAAQMLGGTGATTPEASLARVVAAPLRSVGQWMQRQTAPPAEIAAPLKDDPAQLANPEWWAYHGGTVVGSILPFLAGGAGVSSLAARAPSLVAQRMIQVGGGAALEGLVEGGMVYEQAIQQGKSPQEAGQLAAAVTGKNVALIAATGAAGYVAPMALRAGRTAGTLASRVGKAAGQVGKVVAPAATEGTQEVLQERISDAALGEPTGGRDAEAFLLGAMGGAVIGPSLDALQQAPAAAMQARQQRERVLANLDASRRARASSGFAEWVAQQPRAAPPTPTSTPTVPPSQRGVENYRRIFLAPRATPTAPTPAAVEAEMTPSAATPPEPIPIEAPVRPAEARPSEPASPSEAPPVAAPTRPQAAPSPSWDGLAPPGMTYLDPDEIQVDAEAYQFKSEGDAAGVTPKLKEVREWDAVAGSLSPILVHERTDGTRYVADGHQRVGLAKRLRAEGKPVPPLLAVVLREADGVTVSQARRAAADYNLKAGSTKTIDIARYLREVGLDADYGDIARIRDDAGDKFRQARDLAKLGEAAFRRVVNEEVPPHFARFVGLYLTDPGHQAAAMTALAKSRVKNADEADAFVRQVAAGGFSTAEDVDLFGDTLTVDPLFEVIARLETQASRRLATEKSAFANAVRNAGRIEAAGAGTIARDVAGKEADTAQHLRGVLQRFSTRKSHTAEALRAAAQAITRGTLTDADAYDTIRAAVERDWSEFQSGGGGSAAGDSTAGRLAVEADRAGADTPAVADEPPPYNPDDFGPGLFGEALPSRRMVPRETSDRSPRKAARKRAVSEALGLRARADAVAAPTASVGSPSRRAFSELPSPSNTATPPTTPMSPHEVIADLAQMFGIDRAPQGRVAKALGLKAKRAPLPLEYKKFRQQAFGIYKVDPQAIRLKSAGDLATYAHELGHHIDLSLFGPALPYHLHAAELERVGRWTAPASAPKSRLREEGAAEFWRLFFGEPDRAKALLPGYSALVEQAMAAKPDLGSTLMSAQAAVQQYLAQPLAQRGRAKVEKRGQTTDPDSRTVSERYYDQWIDDLGPLKRVVDWLQARAPVTMAEHAYALARTYRGLAEKAIGWLESGVRDTNGQIISHSFKEALAPVKGREDAFADYLVALRALELHRRQIDPGLTRDEAKAIIAEIQADPQRADFETARDRIYAYQDGVLEYARRARYFSKGEIAAIKTLNQMYVPMQRVMDDAAKLGPKGKARQLANRANPVKRIYGSGREIINPLESIVTNTVAILEAVDANRALLALTRQVEQTAGAGWILQRVPPDMAGQQYSVGTLWQAIERYVTAKASTQDPDLDPADLAVDLDIDAQEVVTLFTPSMLPDAKQRVFMVRDNGDRRFYQVSDQALWDALNALGPNNAHPLLSLVRPFTSTLRAGATLTPEFVLRNLLRDMKSAFVQSRYGFKPGLDTVRGLREVLKRGETYQLFRQAGGGGATLVAQDRQQIRRFLRDEIFAQSIVRHPRDLLKAIADDFRQGGVKVGLGSTADAVLEPLRALSSAIEEATRVGEFARALKKEGVTEAGLVAGGLAAHDVTVDFSRAGSIGRVVNQSTAFFNAQVQGKYRLYEAIKENPTGTAFRIALSSTFPALVLAALRYYFDKDDEWAGLSEAERQTWWHIPTPVGWIRVPKAFDVDDLFGTPAEVAFDYAIREDPAILDQLLPGGRGAAFGALVGVVVPTAFMPAAEVFFNYSVYRDRPIESPFDLERDKRLRYSRWTSETAKAVGPKLGLSPEQFDYLFFGYTAGLGRYALRGTDLALRGGAALVGEGLPSKPSRGFEGVPGLGVFFREDRPTLTHDSVGRLYDEQTWHQNKRRDRKSFGFDSPEGQAITREIAARGGEGRYSALNHAAEQMTLSRKQLDRAFRNRTLTSDEKRIVYDYYVERIVDAANRGLGRPPLENPMPRPTALLSKLTLPPPKKDTP